MPPLRPPPARKPTNWRHRARMLSARSGKALERRATRGGSAMANASVKEQVGDLVTRAKRRVGAEQPSAADDDGRVGIVRGALQTFGDGDTDGFLDALRHDVVWEAPNGGHFPGGGEQLGRDAVKSEFIDNCERTFTDFGFKPETFVDADDTDAVVVIGRYEG